MADENGHQWAEVLGGLLGDRFPYVCSRCLSRSDSVWADQPCDGAVVA